MSSLRTTLIVATALCLATLVYGFDPAKPKPSNVFQASLFTMGPTGYTFVRGYYDGLHKNLRTDFFDQKGEKTLIYIGIYNLKKLYVYNATSHECELMQTPPWADPWAFMKTATYDGSRTLPDGNHCEAWKNDYGQSTTTTCWRGNNMMMQIIEAKHLFPTYTYTTDYASRVDKGVFDLPASCNSSSVVHHFSKPIKRAAEEMPGLFFQNMF